MASIIEFLWTAAPFIALGLGLAFAAVAISQRKDNSASLITTGVAVVCFSLAVFTFGSQMAFASPAVSEDNDSAKTTIGNDIAWAGQSGQFVDFEFANDLLAAGMNVSVDNSKVKGSVRAAGSTVRVTNSNVEQSVTIAGQNVSVDGGKAAGVAMAGAFASFSGETNDLYVAAGNVTINGTVHGDVYVSANRLELGPGTVIDGSIKGELGEKPVVTDGAQFKADETRITDKHANADDAIEAVGSAPTALSIGGAILAALLSMVVFLVIAVLSEVFARRQTEEASTMVKQRTGAMVGSGIVGAICAPIAIVILCALVVTLPVAGALTLVLIAMTLVGGGFAAASLGKLAFPKLGRFQSAMIMAIILGAVHAIPVIGSLVTALGFMYLLGYVMQLAYLAMRSKNAGSADGASPSEPPAAPAAPVAPTA